MQGLLEQLRYLQLAVERMLGAPQGSLDGALPTTKASQQALQQFIDGLVLLSSPPTATPGATK